MKIIKHRVNTIEELRGTPKSLGLEVDVRSSYDELYLHHDPMSEGVSIKDFLEEYSHGPLIFNVKEEGLEPYINDLVISFGIQDWFMLDQSIPFQVKFGSMGMKNSAIRYSKFEPLATLETMAPYASWVWVDCFDGFMLDFAAFDIMKRHMLKVCLVSPELQGRSAENEVPEIKETIAAFSSDVDAVCTKFPNLWI